MFSNHFVLGFVQSKSNLKSRFQVTFSFPSSTISNSGNVENYCSPGALSFNIVVVVVIIIAIFVVVVAAAVSSAMKISELGNQKSIGLRADLNLKKQNVVHNVTP